MARIEDLARGAAVRGVLPEGLVTVVDVKWIGTSAIELTYKDAAGRLGNELIYRDREATLEVLTAGASWTFDADGDQFRLVSEALRIRLAYLFDPLLAVHTSLVEPLPHQITAVYGEMIQRQPLKFLLADDPGSGKTIMAGLLIKELIARADLQKCLIVCPGNRALDQEGEEAAAALLRKVGGYGEIARELAYRLYSICERKKWSQEAQVYNSLVIAWPEISRLSQGIRPAEQLTIE